MVIIYLRVLPLHRTQISLRLYLIIAFFFFFFIRRQVRYVYSASYSTKYPLIERGSRNIEHTLFLVMVLGIISSIAKITSLLRRKPDTVLVRLGSCYNESSIQGALSQGCVKQYKTHRYLCYIELEWRLRTSIYEPRQSKELHETTGTICQYNST